MPTMRSDAARSRTRILEAARGRPSGQIRFNELARETGLGVGTIYRHFATVTSLIEALNIDALEQLAAVARRASEAPSPGTEFIRLVRKSAELLFIRDGLKELLLAEDVSTEVLALREDFHGAASVALDAAIRERLIRADVSVEHIQKLACGVEYAARLGDPAEHSLLLDVMISGLRPSDTSTR